MASDSDLRKSINAQLDGALRDAADAFAYLKKKHDDETKVEVGLVFVLVWFASLLVAAVGFLSVSRTFVSSSPLVAISVITVVAALSGAFTYWVRRRRGFPFAELGETVARLKGGPVTSEDGLKLLDATRQALLAVKKGKVDGAFTDGVVAFLLVGILGFNAAIGLLAGVIVYLYFRFEAIREYEREETRYEESKKMLLESL
jgi:hypothetical protein